ncbi:MAG: DNA topoisomerase I [Lentisphaerae bacterium RIFOXYB12_FULL_65_16]|nr:MAG: DNA topoisomerase I [Lentisphaerae bacterium RIFOXYA12_64_32]OGV86189.1 MAG: DNA topoisomerase I [Lentisphaerae bacterium RIFOXYB12_FULL_65_16]
MSKSLVIVESPMKARTIGRFLARDMRVLASMGHIRDLPESSLGVDVGDRFNPVYVLTTNGQRVAKELRKAAEGVDHIYLATDPDREGEAIAWHIREVIGDNTKATFHRVQFHEITRSAIAAAFDAPGKLDDNKVCAQQARRVLDRLVGYQVSPLLWKQIQKGTSAGRVQSVALRLICERERAIQQFVPVEYWNLNALFQPEPTPEQFTARLTLLDGKKPEVPNAEAANTLATQLEAATFRIVDVAKKPKRQNAPPPFITSTLQQSAGNALRFGASQTMRVAQQLYEGVELGESGPTGLITYMRTDSVAVSQEAQTQAREYVQERFGADYVPEKPNVYRSRESAQEAHETIRPTDVRRTPDVVASFLSPPQLRLYRLIWNRFVASQMAPANILEHVIDVGAEGEHLTHAYLFRATARQTTFPGFLAVYDAKESETNGNDNEAARLPDVPQGTPCLLKELNRDQRFTEPPKRYTEATLVRELEQNGVGRPSTYATIIDTILGRDYVKNEKRVLTPTPLGFSVAEYLVKRLPDLFQIEFTASMESQLDEIESGKVDWTQMLKDFYTRFQDWLGEAPQPSAPSTENAGTFMVLFPDTITWQPPEKRGRRTYDDQAFFLSLKEQSAQGKRLSDKQWLALLGLAARYAPQIPGLEDKAKVLGVWPKMQELIVAAQAIAARPAGEAAAAPDPADMELLQVLTNVNWDPPVKRGRRSFNDRKFYNSIHDQAASGRKLTPPQVESVKKLVLKYQAQIPDYANVVARLDIKPSENAATATADQTDVAPLIAMIDSVREWAAPVKRGRRTYDDREFANSVRDQFNRRGILSDRQIAALRKMLGRYREQIPDSGGLLQAPAKAKTAEPVNANCPECGAQLMRRQGRKGEFFGCSTFPKCRYTTASLPADAAATAPGQPQPPEPPPANPATPN